MARQSLEAPPQKRSGLLRVYRRQRYGRERLICAIEPCGAGSYRFTWVALRGAKVAKTEPGTIVSDDEGARQELGRHAARGGPESVLVIPRSEAIVRWTRVPSVEPKQVAQMISFDVAAHAPWPLEEVSYSYARFPADPGYTRLFLMMVRQQEITQHLARLRSWRINPARVTLSTLAMAKALDTDESDGVGALLLLRDHGGEYLRVEDGVPVFSRGVASDESPAEALQRSVELDVRRSGREARKAAIVLAADGSRLQALELSAKELDLAVQPVTALRPAFLNGAAPTTDLCLTAVAAAASLLTDSEESNLLPQAERRRLGMRAFVRELKLICLGLALIVGATAGLGRQAFEIERSRAADAHAEIAALQQEAGDLVTQYEQLKRLSAERKRVVLPLQVVLELYRLTPADVGIAQMVYEERGNLTLGGEAPSYTSVFNFLAKLGESPLLQDVNLVQSTKPRNASQSMVEFKVQCTVASKGSKP